MLLTNRTSLLLLIIFSQFAGTSLWFAGNAIIMDIQPDGNAADIISWVQFGFIAGTFLFSIFSLADRIPASRLFFLSCFLGAIANLLVIPFSDDAIALSALRFITGLFLAGIYPVGMKIAADIFPTTLGHALGFLVAALVLGKSLPFFIRSFDQYFDWKDVLIFTSALAFLGGLLVLILIPAKKVPSARFDLLAALYVFRSPRFRAASFGYFGHMWELYAFWATLPLLIGVYNRNGAQILDPFFWSFFVMAIGCLGCIAGGLLSRRKGSRWVAFYSLLVSGACCLLAPFFFEVPAILFLVFLSIWGLTVIADSPQFSTLVAQAAEDKSKGTALTIVTSLGFAITIVSIQLLQPLLESLGPWSIWILLPGPLFGLLSLRKWK